MVYTDHTAPPPVCSVILSRSRPQRKSIGCILVRSVDYRYGQMIGVVRLQVRVDLSHRDRRVAEQALDAAKRQPVDREPRRVRVPERVPAEPLVEQAGLVKAAPDRRG